MATYPLLFAFLLAILAFVTRRASWSSWFLVAGSGVQVLLASYLVYLTSAKGQVLQTSLGAWVPPFGISFYIDQFSALMIWISAFLFFVVHLYSQGSPESKTQWWAHQVCWNTLAGSVYGAFATNDLFNLFVWFEVLLLSSYVLFVWGFADPNLSAARAKEGRKGLISYMILNILGSSVFLLGMAVFYSSTGTLNFADFLSLSPEVVSPTVVFAGFCLAFAFTMKAGFFPLFNWLPASYPVGPISAVALFAGLLTKVGVYALIRFFQPASLMNGPWLFDVMMVVANLTMLLGVYGAATHQSLRSILSFHIVSQVGYMALGIAIGTPVALSATIFYLLHHMVVKTNLFLITGAVEKVEGTDELKNLGGLARSHPWLAAAFVISALSLAGLPPFSGFWAKFFVLYSAAQSHSYWGLGIGLFVGLFTLFSMLKIWNEAFLKAPSHPRSRPGKVPWAYRVAILLMCLWTLGLGLYPASLTWISDQAAMQVLDVQQYLRTLVEVKP